MMALMASRRKLVICILRGVTDLVSALERGCSEVLVWLLVGLNRLLENLMMLGMAGHSENIYTAQSSMNALHFALSAMTLSA